MNRDYRCAMEAALAVSRGRLEELLKLHEAGKLTDNAFYISGRASRLAARVEAVRRSIKEFEKILGEKGE